MDRREGQGLDLVKLLVVTFHVHQPVVCPTLDQTSIPEAQNQVGVLCEMTEPVRDKDARAAI